MCPEGFSLVLTEQASPLGSMPKKCRGDPAACMALTAPMVTQLIFLRLCQAILFPIKFSGVFVFLLTMAVNENN